MATVNHTQLSLDWSEPGPLEIFITDLPRTIEVEPKVVLKQTKRPTMTSNKNPEPSYSLSSASQLCLDLDLSHLLPACLFFITKKPGQTMCFITCLFYKTDKTK